MALENKAQKLKRESLDMLKTIVAATQTEVGYGFGTREICDYLAKNGFAEINETITNEANGILMIAVRATTKGVEKVMSENEVTAGAAPKFVIETGIALPVSKRGGNRESAYPFEALEVGQSFFVAGSEKHPEPAKSLASTVSGATKRYDVLVFEEDGTTPKMKEVTNPKTKEKHTVQATKHTRTFTLRPETKDGVVGARIYRTA